MPCKCNVLVLVLDSEKMKMKTEPSPILCSGEQDLQSESITKQLGCMDGYCPKFGKDGRPSYLNRCSWEYLIITWGAMVLAFGWGASSVLWGFLKSALGVSLSGSCASLSLAPTSHPFKGLSGS